MLINKLGTDIKEHINHDKKYYLLIIKDTPIAAISEELGIIISKDYHYLSFKHKEELVKWIGYYEFTHKHLVDPSILTEFLL